MKTSGFKIKRILLLMLTVFAFSLFITACDSSKDSEEEAVEQSENANGSEEDNALEDDQQAEEDKQPTTDDYSDYIRTTLKAVSEVTPTPVPPDPGKVIVVDSSDNPQNVFVSASDDLSMQDYDNAFSSSSTALLAQEDYDDTPLTTANSESSSSDASSSSSSSLSAADSSGSSNPNDNGLTPDDFPVGTSCIYISGEVDDTYGSDLITALNKARTDLGYPELIERTGLNKCADRRSREITSMLSHLRPNATPFYSLAPQYFKAEMLAVDGATPQETIDAWVRDPNSRTLVFTTKYTSVGAACFKCNGLKCIVVALGY